MVMPQNKTFIIPSCLVIEQRILASNAEALALRLDRFIAPGFFGGLLLQRPGSKLLSPALGIGAVGVSLVKAWFFFILGDILHICPLGDGGMRVQNLILGVLPVAMIVAILWRGLAAVRVIVGIVVGELARLTMVKVWVLQGFGSFLYHVLRLLVLSSQTLVL